MKDQTRDQWTDRLSEYLDGELGVAERAALEELRRVVARAQGLDDRPPTADLWPAIAEQIGVARLAGRRARRRFSFTVPQLAAASVALALCSGGVAWLLVRSRVPPPVATAPSPSPGATAGVPQ